MVLLGLAGCVSKARFEELETRLAATEARLAAVERDHNLYTAVEAAIDEASEAAAAELSRLATAAYDEGRFDAARAHLDELTRSYPESKAAKRAGRLANELAIIGIDAGELLTTTWYQGTPDPRAKVLVLVFWETWDPHGKKALPVLQQQYTRFHPRGLEIVGLTKVTRTSTDDAVRAYLVEYGLTFPIAKEEGAMSTRYAVNGIPAVGVVQDGKVIWRGHPARITDAMIEAWLR